MLNYSYEELTSTEFHVNIARRLHFERIYAELSLDDLAEKIGYTKPTVQSWEKGWRDGTGLNRIPTMEQLIDLAALYNCTPEYLLCEYDEKTKQATDISIETGLYPESITKLQRMFYSILEHPHGGGGANDLFLAFLNHYILNIDLINELIFNRQMLVSVQQEFDNEPDKDLILEGYLATNNGIMSEIFKDAVFSSTNLAAQFTEPMVKYFESKGLTVEHITQLMQKFTYYFDIISNNKIKQSDFALSDSFLDIVKSFYAEFPDIVYGIGGYDDYVDFQRQHINPERLQPAPIVRADDN